MKSVVLLSGGLDSTTNLYAALKAGKVALAITLNYGQRAFVKEEAAAQYFCRLNNVPHKTIDVSFIRELGKSSLTDRKMNVPQGLEVSIDDMQRSQATAKSVWVPNRNGILLNVAAGFAEALGADTVVPGFNKEEAATFPDNSEAFVGALNESLKFSTQGRVRTHCFTIQADKTEIVKMAVGYKVPLEKLWSCYLDGVKWCGQCESCLRLKRALKANHLDRLADF